MVRTAEERVGYNSYNLFSCTLESLPTACRKGGDFVVDYIEQDLKLK